VDRDVRCAGELRSEREWRLWRDELERPVRPWPQDRDTLFVSYHVPGRAVLYWALGRPMPPSILDLCIEYRQVVNGVVDKDKPRSLQA
jgi:hypothetical protein